MSFTARAAIFDLDGVLVDTAQFHLAAWRRIAREFGFELDPAIGESLKGVGREAALTIVARSGGLELDPAQFRDTAARKNRYYNEHLETLGQDALLAGSIESLTWLRDRGIPIALASASRNARTILASTGIGGFFDAIVDGEAVKTPKPDPEVFVVAAISIGVAPADCVVFEDAIAGVAGARRAGCHVIGIGDPLVLTDADSVVPDLAAVDWTALFDTGVAG
jgi:beta-phosphoglucomutase